jgi:hypothetical protein
VIRFSKVFKAFPKGSLALKDVSLHVAKGEFLFLTGHSGAGKSTILRLTYADELPTSGTVRVSGFSTADLERREIPKLRRRLGVVFQDFRLLEDRTAEENVAFALEVTNARRSTIAPKVMRVLTQVGLAAKALAYPRELSGATSRPATSTNEPPEAYSSSSATSMPPGRRLSWPRTISTSFGRRRTARSNCGTGRWCTTRRKKTPSARKASYEADRS